MSDWHTAFNALKYTFGNCTRFVAGTLSFVGSNWGNACQWADSAKKDGLSVSPTPTVNSIAVYDCGLGGSGGNGHVAVVSALNGDGSFTLSEANWDGFNLVDTRNESLSTGTGKHIVGFILPPGQQSSNSVSTLSANPLDSIGSTVSAFGKQIHDDILRVALTLLGLFVVLTGVGLLLSEDARSTISQALKESTQT